MQWGPAARTDARHKVSLSAVFQLPWGIYASPVFRYRSALPLHIWTGYDVNADGVSNDIYPTAFKLNERRRRSAYPSYEEIGACETVNCGRGAALSTFNLRVSKVFRLPHGMNIEAIAEGLQPLQRDQPELRDRRGRVGGVLHGHGGQSPPNAVFMKPTAYSGDAGQPEQRVGQIGFRFTF